jgi:hypothetical protein
METKNKSPGRKERKKKKKRERKNRKKNKETGKKKMKLDRFVCYFSAEISSKQNKKK